MAATEEKRHKERVNNPHLLLLGIVKGEAAQDLPLQQVSTVPYHSVAK